MAVAATVYAEALEQQLSLARAVQGPMGEAALAQFGVAINQSFATAGMRFSTANGVLAKMVAHATPYFWCAPLSSVLHTAARTIPEYTFTESSFPTPNGYVWLEETVPLIERLPGDFVRTAMNVHVHGVDEWDATAESYESPYVLRAWSWHTVPDHGAVLLWAYIPAFERRAGLPMLQAPVSYGQTLPAAMVDVDARESPGAADAPPLSPENEVTRGDLIQRMHHAFMAVVAASLSFLEQELVLATPLPLPRATRRRLKRERLPDPEAVVRVVELRAPHYTHVDAGADHQAPDWHYRWFVRGHWRRQWYPKAEAHKPLWIAPHVKGPEGLPVKSPATTIYAVRR